MFKKTHPTKTTTYIKHCITNGMILLNIAIRTRVFHYRWFTNERSYVSVPGGDLQNNNAVYRIIFLTKKCNNSVSFPFSHILVSVFVGPKQTCSLFIKHPIRSHVLIPSAAVYSSILDTPRLWYQQQWQVKSFIIAWKAGGGSHFFF